MKTQSSCRNSGFTLVELLVVIAIIAVLAAAGFSAGHAAIQRTKKTTALNTCTSLEIAVAQYFADYGAMPVDGMNTDTVIETNGSGVSFLNVLLGLDGTGANAMNTRAIKFLSVKEGKNNKNGLIYNGDNVAGLFDPWGGPYKVALDGDNDEKLTVTPTNGTAVTLRGRRAAAWSEGADYNAARKIGDDVYSWGK
jgi:prepilin-type N-terminal cleavage/methylation domain-containing protein